MTETDKNPIAIGYTRLSQQSDTSIDTQKRRIREYCDEYGFELVEIFDEGEQSSGFTPANLKEWTALRDVIQNNGDRTDFPEIDALIVRGKRRLARDIDEVMRFIPDVRDAGIEVHTVQDGKLDLSDPMNAAIEILQAAAAFEEKLAEIEKAVEITEKRAENGYWSGEAPYGLHFGVNEEHGKRLIPLQGECRSVLNVLQLRGEGASYRVIERETGVPLTTAWRICRRRDVYRAAAERAVKHGLTDGVNWIDDDEEAGSPAA
ncbi:recombinase family protein [Halorubrum sp. DTA98]|uniref:recombinase family protein n=1 Tax=Halorubrum sp. DTA98 TaxID=3402163 RepID=UPI003AACFD04